MNKKLNALINKINMMHQNKETAQAMIQDASEKALRTFVTGLKGNLGQILYSANCTTLPEAYARIQTIVNDQERIKFANQFNGSYFRNNQSDHSNFGKKQEPNVSQNFKMKQKFPFQGNQNKNEVEPMEVDRSSMKVNINKSEKRNFGQFSRQSNDKKFQRINQVETKEEEGEEEEEKIPNVNEMSEHENVESDEIASIFLGN